MQLVKRKIGGVVGVLMDTKEDPDDPLNAICEVAFGFLTPLDAENNKVPFSEWEKVERSHLTYISGTS